MARHFTDAEILNAIWAWGGRVYPAARNQLHMHPSQCYERLKLLGIDSDTRLEFAVKGTISLPSGFSHEVPADVTRYMLPDESKLSGLLDPEEGVWDVGSVGRVGSVGSVGSVQEKDFVGLISADTVPSFDINDSDESRLGMVVDAAPVTILKRAWVAKPSRSATLRVDRALLELAEVGKDTDRDAFLEAFLQSDHFEAFKAEIVALYRHKKAETK
jgi:hypothetical protein